MFLNLLVFFLVFICATARSNLLDQILATLSPSTHCILHGYLARKNIYKLKPSTQRYNKL